MGKTSTGTDTVVIADAGPIIHLDELGCIDLLTDDTAARLAAKSLGVAAHGTIGILVRAIRRQIRSKPEVPELLRNIPTKTTLHFRPSSLAEVIREVEASAK
ncbi:MAG: hypothetical protein ACU837_13590 [Gammaproteobacteria bacterium]